MTTSKDTTIIPTLDVAEKNMTEESLPGDEQEHSVGFKVSEKIPDISSDKPTRGEWGNKLDFLFSCITVSIGFGNIWRFPYMCCKNGGGAFLIVYFMALIFCGVPILFQEVVMGQYLRSGGLTLVSQLCPILKGVGLATMTVVLFHNIYYFVMIAWTIFYFFVTFWSLFLKYFPWDTCDDWWNTEYCFRPTNNWTADDILIANYPMKKVTKNGVLRLIRATTSPVEEFWDNRVLMKNKGLDHGLGTVQWELLVCLFLAWVCVYLIISRGLHSSGKIIWFTVLFPFVALLILICRAVTLEGAVDALAYFIHLDGQYFKDPTIWIDGVTQVFISYNIGMGTLPALGSYNKFHHNCFRDVIITCMVNTLTCLLGGVLVFSLIGYMAHIQETTIHDLMNSGPGLLFLTFPDVVVSFPGSFLLTVLWTILLFAMVIVLGIGSAICNVESLVTGIVDHWPDNLLKHRKLFTVSVCLLLFFLGIPLVTNGGTYIFQLMDFYSCLPLLWVCLFQTLAISWFFGPWKLRDCVEKMTQRKPNIVWFFCWVLFSPIVLLVVFVFYCISYTSVKYEDDYNWLGLCMALTSMIWVPGYAIYYAIYHAIYSLVLPLYQKLRAGSTQNMKQMQNIPQHKAPIVSKSVADL